MKQSIKSIDERIKVIELEGERDIALINVRYYKKVMWLAGIIGVCIGILIGMYIVDWIIFLF